MEVHECLFRADWLDAVFIHFRVDPRRLQPLVPLELDTWDDSAMVSLVAFRQAGLRLIGLGPAGGWLTAPLATHDFLNLRTYVRAGDERGIFFISEWIPNRLAVLIGPRMYGLPYRLGRLRYAVDRRRGVARGVVRAGRECLEYRARFDPSAGFATAQPATIDHFLCERYVAFTSSCGRHRRFHVDHDRWPLARCRVELCSTCLLQFAGAWLNPADVLCTHYSPGVRNVLIGPPRRQTFADESVTLPGESEGGVSCYVQSPC